ncbi:hypothetical protein D3C80_542660 [compost metagenome]
MVGQRAADQYRAVQRIAGGGFDAHYHAAVIEQQLVTNTAVFDQVRIVDADNILGAIGQRVGSREREAITDFELNTLVGEFGDTNLWTLQVAEQCYMATQACCNLTDQTGASFVLVGRAVGEVQASNIQAGKNQLFDNFRRVAGGAKGGDDFGTADGHAQTPIVKRSERLLWNLAVVIVPLHYLGGEQAGI